MRILFTGSRTWTDEDTIVHAITEAVLRAGAKQEETIFVHGACPRGADRIVADLAERWGVTVEAYPADWDTFGRRAGFVRNRHMVDLGADICLAFIKDNSKGSTHTANLAQAANIPTKIYRE